MKQIRKFVHKHPLGVLVLGILILTLPILIYVLQQQSNLRNFAAIPSPNPLMLISRNIPAFSTSGNANEAVDDTYNTVWKSNEIKIGTSETLTLNLSQIPIDQKQRILFVWYNETTSYAPGITHELAYNIPENYTIEINDETNTTPPLKGWKTIENIQDNHYHSRQHILELHGANWIRLSITKAFGSIQNFAARINVDIYDAKKGTDDNFIFYGDSITADTMGHYTTDNTPSLNQILHQQKNAHYPVMENGGVSYLTSADATKLIPEWIPFFPGKYVGLAYGTNDAWGCKDPQKIADTVYNNYLTIVKTLITKGKTPIIALMPWSERTDIQTCAQAINAKLQQLPSQFSEIITGPDFYTMTKDHPEYFSDGVHFNRTGAAVYRQAWATDILAKIYTDTGVISPIETNPTQTPTINLNNSFIIDDTIMGKGVNQWNYTTRNWNHCNNCSEANITYYGDTQSWNMIANEIASLPFSGRQLKLYATTAPWYGIAAISLDNGREILIDLFSNTKKSGVPIWTSSLLPPGNHTVKIRVTGNKNPTSTDTVVNIDYAEIMNSPSQPSQ